MKNYEDVGVNMNLYLLTQDDNYGYDTYDSCIVAAESEEKAKQIDPSGFYKYHDGNWWFQYSSGKEEKQSHDSWASIQNIKVKKIGTTDLPAGLILASYNAG